MSGGVGVLSYSRLLADEGGRDLHFFVRRCEREILIGRDEWEAEK